MKFLDLNYHFFDDTIDNTVKKYKANFGFLNYFPDNLEVVCLVQGASNSYQNINRVEFLMRKGKLLNKFDIPKNLHKKIASLAPNYILIHGLRYGLYAYFLKRKLKNNPIIIVQAHGYAEAPIGIKKYVYKWANSFIDGYIFTGKPNAKSWVENRIFQKDKIFEIMEGSTDFEVDATIARKNKSYLWVGRLNRNKDPLTILNAFEKYLKEDPNSTLTMVYHTYNLYNEVLSRIKKSELLGKSVVLVGKVERKEIKKLYQTHQFFVLGSHSEGSGYALLESMACGCIPIVTKIPPYEYMTNHGECGFLFAAGNTQELLSKFKESQENDTELLREKVKIQFQRKLSFKVIANDIYEAFEELSRRRL